MHRLLAECAEEPERYQIKKSIDESFQTEFADTILSFLVLDRLLGDFAGSPVI